MIVFASMWTCACTHLSLGAGGLYGLNLGKASCTWLLPQNRGSVTCSHQESSHTKSQPDPTQKKALKLSCSWTKSLRWLLPPWLLDFLALWNVNIALNLKDDWTENRKIISDQLLFIFYRFLWNLSKNQRNLQSFCFLKRKCWKRDSVRQSGIPILSYFSLPRPSGLVVIQSMLDTIRHQIWCFLVGS